MIKINLKVTNMEATPDIRGYLDKKLGKIEDFAGRVQDEVILRVEIGRTTTHHQQGNVYRAEFQTHLYGKELRAVSEKEDLYQAIDEAKDEMIREIKSGKEKSETLLKKSGRAIKNAIRNFYNDGNNS